MKHRVSERTVSRRGLLFGLVGGVGCTSQVPPTKTASRSYPGKLRPPSAMGFDFQWRQKVTAHWGQKSRSFEAVLSVSDGVLQLVGLGPLGTPGFVLAYDGRQITFENRTGRELPFPPRYILMDVQHVFFPWLGPGLRNGTRTQNFTRERVFERWSAGRLQERRFHRYDAAAQGEIRVSYRGWQRGAGAPESAELANGRFGYRLVIETLGGQRL